MQIFAVYGMPCPISKRGLSPRQVLSFVLETWLVTLREPSNDISGKWFTREILEGKGKEPGWVQMTMCKYPVVRQVLALVANVPNSSDAIKSAKDKVTSALASPLAYVQTLLKEQVVLEEDGGVSLAPDSVSYEASDVDLEKLCENIPKCLAKFCEILHGLHAGHFDDETKALGREASQGHADGRQ